jgi:Cu(I)/Ag(I) efflux system membrane fusion protein
MDLVRAEDFGVVGDPDSYEEPLVVPKTAVLVTGTRAIVYVKVPGTEKPTFEGREVVLGPRAGDFYIVREGLSEGDEVVTNGAFKIDSAMQIAAKPSMMMPGGGGGGGHAHHGGPAAAGVAVRVAVPDRFVFGLKPVYAAYFDAQEALAGDDLGGFVLATEDLQRAVGFVDTVGLVGEPLGAWRRLVARLKFDRPPTDIATARMVFERVSMAVLDAEKRFGHHGSRTWYGVFCPMAFDEKGAEWLQRGETILNPYLGAARLRCGEIRSRFTPLQDGDDHAGHGGDDHE